MESMLGMELNWDMREGKREEATRRRASEKGRGEETKRRGEREREKATRRRAAEKGTEISRVPNSAAQCISCS